MVVIVVIQTKSSPCYKTVASYTHSSLEGLCETGLSLVLIEVGEQLYFLLVRFFLNGQTNSMKMIRLASRPGSPHNGSLKAVTRRGSLTHHHVRGVTFNRG